MDQRGSSNDLVAAALQAQMQGISERLDQVVNNSATSSDMSELKKDFRASIEEIKTWQSKIDAALQQLATHQVQIKNLEQDLSSHKAQCPLIAEMAAFKTAVKEHENMINQGKGALLASKMMWAVVVGMIAFSAYAIKEMGEIKKSVTAQNLPAASVVRP